MTARADDADDTEHVRALVRAHDLPRYYAALFAPPELRADLLAIYAFAAEVARVPNQVREPALGEIRLKWWSEALGEAVRREGRGDTPALTTTASAIIRRSLPLSAFEALVDAQAGDLYADSPETVTELEARLGATQSALFQLTAIVLGASGPETADASGHAGVAYGIARRLSQYGAERARGRSIIPADILAGHSLSGADIFADPPPAHLEKAVGDLAARGRGHFNKAQSLAGDLPRALRSAFLPLAVVPPLLARVDRSGPEILRHPAVLSPLETLSRIGWARLAGFSRSAGRE
jgi:phytoene synthase